MTRKIKHFISYTILIIASLLSVFPLYYMLSGATNKSIDIVRGRLIPGGYLVENFRTLVANQNLGLAMFNSFRNAILITIISLLVCSIAGYGFEIYHDKGKDTLMTILLLSMMLPFVALMIPLFKMFSTMGLVAMTITFMNAWNNYLWPKVILQDNASITMPMLVANLKSGYSVDYGMLMLGVLICTLPTAIIFFCLQKSFSNGLTGAVK